MYSCANLARPPSLQLRAPHTSLTHGCTSLAPSSMFRRIALQAPSRTRSLTVGNIVRTVRGRVAGETEANQLDDVCRAFSKKISGQPGCVRHIIAAATAYLLTHSPSGARSPLTSYLKTTRKVCMSEFDYEIQMVFDNLDNFKVSEISRRS